MARPHTEPFERFATWMDKAKDHPSIGEPTAMALASATPDGKPSVRMVLLKAFDTEGFVFYTNLDGRKAQELKENPHAALCFHWEPLGKQFRVEGRVEQVSNEEADAYFASRPRKSRLGAWASLQSRPLKHRRALMGRIIEYTAKFAFKKVPRPQNWSGFRIIPQRIEFWKEGDFRIHKRELYTRTDDGWDYTLLYP